MAIRLAIVGSRRFCTPWARQLADWIMRRAIEHFDPDLVVSGGAGGTDTWAMRMAVELGVPTHICLPGVRRWKSVDGRVGFKERNMKIARRCTHLLSIRCCQSETYGAGWTADKAEELGRQVYRRII